MRALLHGILEFLLPPVCLACDGAIATGDDRRLVCRRCRTRLRRVPPPWCWRCGAPRLHTGRTYDPAACEECCDWPAQLLGARSAFLMHPPADRIVHQLKYRGWSALAGVMGESMAQTWLTNTTDRNLSVVMPVPTTRSRMRERGYNQAELLARVVAAALGKPHALLLERTSSRSTQTTLQPAARGANVAGAFRLSPHVLADIRGGHVLIVDDVLTTGATTIECTRTLIAAGVRGASVLTFARALDTRRLLG